MIGDDLLRYKEDQTYLTFDFETENLCGLFGNRPWEFGYRRDTLKRDVESNVILINWPNLNVSKGAAAKTGYYDKAHRIKTEGLSPKEGLGVIKKALFGGDIIVGQNVFGFDAGIFGLACRELGETPDYSFIYRMLDTSLLAKGHKLGLTPPKFGTDEFVEYMYKLYNVPVKGIKTNLKQLCMDYEVEYDESTHHQADYDILLTIQVFRKMVWKIEI